MDTKKERLKKLIAESEGFLERANKVVKRIAPVDTSKIVLSSDPFSSKRKTVPLT
jgi:hypothetical protein